MSIVDFAGLAALILSVAAALDFLVRAETKRRFSSRLREIATRTRGQTLHASRLADKFFGRGLLTPKSVSRYATISVASLSLTYIFAYTTTPNGALGDIVSIFFGTPKINDIIMVSLAVLSAITADILSYAQTRIFIRAVDRYRNIAVSVGLVISDGLISVGLLVMTFSVARFLSYLIVISANDGTIIVSTTYYLPGIPTSNIQNIPIDNSKSRAFLRAIGNFYVDKNESNLDLMTQAYDRSHVNRQGFIDHLIYFGEIECVKIDNVAELYAAIGNSHTLGQEIISGRYGVGRAADIISGQMNKDLDKLKADITSASSGNNCISKIIAVKRGVRRKDLLFEAGVKNAFLSAVERTLFDTYAVMGFKFAPYEFFDPYRSQPQYFSSLRTMTTVGFLGIGSQDKDTVYAFSLFPDTVPAQDGKLQIPFSPLLASSLSVTIIFVLYLLYILVVIIRNLILVSILKIIPRIELDKAIHTSIALVICIVMAAVIIIGKFIEVMWTVILA